MKNFCWLIVCFFTLSVRAQEKLVVFGKTPNAYVKHKIAAGEALSTIANQYGSTSAQLAKFNGIKPSTLLKKGMILKIPLTRNNLAQGQSASFNEPVYHVVVKGDNLYHISQSFHNVNIQLLRDWNGLKKDVIRDGQSLVVGYIKSGKKTELTQASVTPATTTEVTAVAPVTAAPSPAKKNQPAVATKEPVVEAKKETTVTAKTEEPKTQPVITVDKKEEPKPADDSKYVPRQGDEGFFALQYANRDQHAAQQFRAGDAGIFKTISGWTDRKFYVLMNDVPPGTIVRITSTSNKSICAKVLDGLVETKGAAGLLLRMSNAAAVALDITDPKATVSVSFFE